MDIYKKTFQTNVVVYKEANIMAEKLFFSKVTLANFQGHSFEFLRSLFRVFKVTISSFQGHSLEFSRPLFRVFKVTVSTFQGHNYFNS